MPLHAGVWTSHVGLSTVGIAVIQWEGSSQNRSGTTAPLSVDSGPSSQWASPVRSSEMVVWPRPTVPGNRGFE